MDDGLKQRLVGAVVLVAVGVIFIPTLLNDDGRREVDVTTQVPPEPVVMPRPLNISDPVPVDNVPAPKSPEENYNQIVDTQAEANTPAAPERAATAAGESQPPSELDDEGIPRAWSIQVSSFALEKNAVEFEQKLKDAGYTAYTRNSTVDGKAVFRIFVGPKINRETALKTKDDIDKAFKTNAMLVEFKP